MADGERGRPSDFTPEMANEICERIVASESLKAICADEHIVSESTVRNWLARGMADEEPYARFLRQYACAREGQADTDADAVGEIGRKCLVGEYDPQAARVAIDALKWSAAKRAPKKYGDKIAHVGGDEGDAPIRHRVEQVQRVIVDPTHAADTNGAGLPAASEPGARQGG